uniref:Reverse transcriptase domain-containing protein n=1 Tax=Photinus pyralis TaxID=7054 RepID=A0A1Y1MJP9_PHOPY
MTYKIEPNHTKVTVSEPLCITEINEIEIGEAIDELKPKKCSGPDGIPAYVLKGCKDIFVPVFKILFNISIKANKFPSKWKSTKVCPLHKSGSKKNIANYRPIAVLSAPAKIFEKVLQKRIIQSCQNRYIR